MGIRITMGNAVPDNSDQFVDQVKGQINPIPKSDGFIPGSMNTLGLKNGGKVKAKPKAATSGKKDPADAKFGRALKADIKADKKELPGLKGKQKTAEKKDLGMDTKLAAGFKRGGKVKK